MYQIYLITWVYFGICSKCWLDIGYRILEYALNQIERISKDTKGYSRVPPSTSAYLMVHLSYLLTAYLLVQNNIIDIHNINLVTVVDYMQNISFFIDISRLTVGYQWQKLFAEEYEASSVIFTVFFGLHSHLLVSFDIQWVSAVKYPLRVCFSIFWYLNIDIGSMHALKNLNGHWYLILKYP